MNFNLTGQTGCAEITGAVRWHPFISSCTVSRIKCYYYNIRLSVLISYQISYSTCSSTWFDQFLQKRSPTGSQHSANEFSHIENPSPGGLLLYLLFQKKRSSSARCVTSAYDFFILSPRGSFSCTDALNVPVWIAGHIFPLLTKLI